MKTRLAALLLLLAFLIVPGRPEAANPAHTFGWKGEHFLLDGKPFVIRGGEMQDAKSIVASCVLSPISARNTVTNTEKKARIMAAGEYQE